MNTRRIDRLFFDLVQLLKENPALNILSYSYPNKIDEPSQQAIDKIKLPGSLVQFLQMLNGLHLSWENRVQDTTFIEGSIRILPGTEIAKDWNRAVYFDDATSAGRHTFYPVDFFADEACCGVFAGGEKETMHYYAFSSGNDPYDLGLNIADYVCLAIDVKCYRYWPLIITLITEKENNPIIQKFSNDMAALFPEFSVEKFVNKYGALSKK